MISEKERAEIRRLFYAEHWKVGTICAQLGYHHDTVEAAIESHRFVSNGKSHGSKLDPYLPFIKELLEKYPRLRSTRIYEMLVSRGCVVSASHVRRVVGRLRPRPKSEAFLRLRTMPGEQGQVDWGHFGKVKIGRALRPLMAFVMVLSWSRGLHVLFTLDAKMESFLRGHVSAFKFFGGVPRVLLYDNLKSAVLSRHRELVEFNPKLLEFCGHYHFEPRPVTPARGNEKGIVERLIRWLRDRFMAARDFRDVDDLNAQFVRWRAQWAHARPCPGDPTLTVTQALEKERQVLLPLPENDFSCETVQAVCSGKTPYVRFDLNDYSIPHELVRKPLTLVATYETVRVLDGQQQVAEHQRSWDKCEQVEQPAHIEKLAAEKREARLSRGRGRLNQVVPEIDEMLLAAMDRGVSLGRATHQLLHLLDDYGDAPFKAAVKQAMERGTPTPSAVAYLLDQAQRQSHQPPVVAVTLPNRPGVREARVTPHKLETYDALSQNTDDDDAT